MKLSRYVQRFHIQLDAQNVSEVLEESKQYDKTVLESHQIKVRVKEDGSLRMKLLPRGHYSPPNLNAKIIDESGKATLQGMIKESFVEGFTYWIFLFLSIFMTAVTVILLLNKPFWLAVVICGVGALVFAIITFLLGRLRNINFHLDGAVLIDGMGLIFLPFIHQEGDYETQQTEEEI